MDASIAGLLIRAPSRTDFIHVIYWVDTVRFLRIMRAYFVLCIIHRIRSLASKFMRLTVMVFILV